MGMRRTLQLPVFWILLLLFLAFFVARVVLFTEDVTNLIDEMWD